MRTTSFLHVVLTEDIFGPDLQFILAVGIHTVVTMGTVTILPECTDLCLVQQTGMVLLDTRLLLWRKEQLLSEGISLLCDFLKMF